MWGLQPGPTWGIYELCPCSNALFSSAWKPACHHRWVVLWRPTWNIHHHQYVFSSVSDIQTGPPNHKGISENTAIIAGVVAALALLVALTLLAVYYINTHPTVAPPFYLMQVRTPPHIHTQCLKTLRSFFCLSASCSLIHTDCLQRRTNNYWPSMKFRNQGCHSSYAEVELGGHEKEGFIEAEQCC